MPSTTSKICLSTLAAFAAAVALVRITGFMASEYDPHNGAVGAVRDASGGLPVSLTLCSGAIDTITLHGPDTNGERVPDEPLGIWRAATPVTSDTTLDLTSLGVGWTVEQDPGPLAPGTLYTVSAHSGTGSSSLAPVSFVPERLQKAAQGHTAVSYRGDAVLPTAEVRARVCHEAA